MIVEQNKIKKVSFGTINDSKIQTLATNASVAQNYLYWCKGILFSFEPFMPTDWISRQAADGNLYYFSLTKTIMKEYSESIKINSSGVGVPVINLENNKFWVEVLENV
jgi:hypothetical protein